MSSRNLDARAAQGSASASAAQADVRPEKRGRFEVWPEQTISYNDWLALPKAPVGHLEFLRNNGLLESSRNRIANIDMTTARRAAVEPAIEAPFDAVPMPTQASVAALVASGVAPDAATAVLRQYSSALSALTTLRGSLLGLGKVIGMDGEGGGHASAAATTGRPPLPAMGPGSSSSASAVSNTDAMTVIHRDDPHEPSSSVTYVRGDSISALPQTVPAPPPPLQRTYSALSSGTVASAMNDTSSEVGPRAAVGSVVTPGAGGGTMSALSELERLRADLEASRQSKSKLLQDNKALQEKLEKTANELTVTQQKLRRIGVQA